MFDSGNLLFYAKWRLHHCGQTITFLFHLTIKQKTRSLLLCPDERRPSRLLCALSGEVASSLVCIHGTEQCALSAGLSASTCWHQQCTYPPGRPWWWSLDSFSPLSHPPGQHRCHFWLLATSSEIFHSAERLVFLNNTLHCSHWNLKTFRYGVIFLSWLVSSHNAQPQVFSELLCLSHDCSQTNCRELLFFTCWVD